MKPNVLPTPTSVCRDIVPPIRVTMRRHKVRPRPVPSSRDGLPLPLLEGLEDPLPVLGGDPDSVVGHRHGQPLIGANGPHRDLATVGGELHRVAEQVQHHLLEPELVGLDEIEARVHLERDRDAVQRGPFPHQGDRVLDRPAQREHRKLQLHPPGLHLGEVEDLVQQLEKVLARVEDVAQVFLLTLVQITEHPLEQHLGESDHGVQRCSQLVRHAGQKVGLVLAGHLQLGSLALELAKHPRVEHR